MLRLILISALALMLPACSSFDFGDLPWNNGKPAGQSAPPPPPPAGGSVATEPRQQTARPAPAPAERAVRPPSPPAPAPADIKLVGLSQAETQAVLGPPSTESDAAPAKVWQYRGRDCVLDVYFYLDVSRNGFYALHYATRGPGGVGPTLAGGESDRCVRRIHDDNRQR